MTPLVERYAALIEEFWGPRDTKTPWEWIEAHCYLAVSSGAKVTGWIDTGITPYFRPILEAYDDPGVREITIAKSAQIGASLMMCCLTCFDVVRHPGSQLLVTSTGDVANEFNDRSLEPQIQRCTAVNALAIKEKGHWTKGEKEFKNGAKVGLIGSNSPARLAGRPVARLKLDEIDKYPSAGDKEAAAIDLAQARTKAFEEQRKIWSASTPTIERGPIWQKFLAGTQEYFEVKCPKCGTWQVLEFVYSEEGGGLHTPEECRREDGTWDLDRVQKETFYACKECKIGWEESDKPGIIATCRPKSMNPNAQLSNRSFHISALYSPFETWGGIAKKYLVAKTTTGGLHDFHNNYLGKPWSGHAITLEPSHLRTIQDESPAYKRGDLPNAPIVWLFMTIDVQKMHFWWVIRAWAHGNVSYLIDYGRVLHWEDLRHVFFRKYMLEGREYQAVKAMVDSGAYTKDAGGVYDWCSRMNRKWFPSKGGKQTDPVVEKPLYGRKLILVSYDDNTYKTELYERRIKLRDGPGWFLPRDLTPEYYAQMTSESLEQKNLPNGIINWEWECPNGNNHLGDCEKMQLVFGDMRGIKQSLLSGPVQQQPEEPPEQPSPPEDWTPSEGADRLPVQL